MKRAGVVLFAAVTLLFLVVLGTWSISLIISGFLPSIVAGALLLFFVLLGVWGLWAEIAFGYHAQRLGSILEADGELPDEEVDLHPSGRVMRSDAETLLPRYKAEAEAAPDDWRAMYRLGLVYDAMGERREARSAIRKAIRLEKAAR